MVFELVPNPPKSPLKRGKGSLFVVFFQLVGKVSDDQSLGTFLVVDCPTLTSGSYLHVTCGKSAEYGIVGLRPKNFMVLPTNWFESWPECCLTSGKCAVGTCMGVSREHCTR